jgi:hypothetical protein
MDYCVDSDGKVPASSTSTKTNAIAMSPLSSHASAEKQILQVDKDSHHVRVSYLHHPELIDNP